MQKTLVASLSLWLFGCAARPPKAQLIIPRHCITDVHLSDDTKCIFSEKDKKWHCSPLVIDRLVACEQVSVVKKEKENRK